MATLGIYSRVLELQYWDKVLTMDQPTITDERIKPKNKSITFRLDSFMLSRLSKEADEKVISVNMLVSQIIKRHIDWHSMAPKAGFVPVMKDLITHLLDNLSDEQVSRTAEQIARTTNMDFLMLLKNKISIDSALDFIESWLTASDIAYRHERTDFNHTFVICHNMGQKWSTYLGELCNHLFKICNASEFRYEARHSTLTFVLETGRWLG
jgi:hypothetical protein